MPHSSDSPSTVTGSTKTSTSLMMIPILDRVAAVVTVGHLTNLTRSSVANLGHAVFSTAKSLLLPKPRRYLQFASWARCIEDVTQQLLLPGRFNCLQLSYIPFCFYILSCMTSFLFSLLHSLFRIIFSRLHSDILLGFCLYLQLYYSKQSL